MEKDEIFKRATLDDSGFKNRPIDYAIIIQEITYQIITANGINLYKSLFFYRESIKQKVSEAYNANICKVTVIIINLD